MKDAIPEARILLVDDKPTNLRLLERLLQQSGYRHFRSLSDSRLVLATCEEFQPDLLLLDLMMPYLDGFGVIEQLKSSLPDRTYLPVLVLTADHSPESKRRALACGAHDFLCKPIDANELALRIRNLLRTRFLYLELEQHNQVLKERVAERTREVVEQANLIDQASDAILTTDLDDRIRFWSRGAERVYGWTSSEAVAQQAGPLLLRSGHEHWAEAGRVTGRIGRWAGEFVTFHREGSEVQVASRWTLLFDERGQPRGRLVLNTDISEQKCAQNHLLRAQRLESIGTLASGLAHDLNNVLTPILTAASLLKRRIMSPEERPLLDVIAASAERGAGLLKRMLTFARGGGGERLPFPLAVLVSELAKVLRQTFPRAIEVVCDLAPDLWLVSADVTQIEQLVMNLCVNARDAMPEGGRLTLRARNAMLGEKPPSADVRRKPGRYVVFEVIDTGSGIPPAVLDKIFDPFFTTKDLDKGTGLGLYTVQGIVKGHDGFLEVDSTVGRGSRFTVYLPAIEVPAPPPLAKTMTDFALGQGELILVVDDEPNIRETTRGVLEAAGYRVVTAADGSQALSCFSEHRADVRLVLTDVMMPGMDGPRMVQELRQLEPAVKVVTMSGLAHDAATPPVPSPAARLAKPYSTEDLLATVQQVLDTPI